MPTTAMLCRSMPSEALQQSSYCALITHEHWRHYCCCACLGSVPTFGHREFFRGHGGTIGEWVAFGTRPTVPEQVMCHICRQRGWVGAHLGTGPVELGLGWWRWGARECRHTSDWSLYVGGGLNGQKDTGTGCIPMQRQRGTQASGILFTQQRLKCLKLAFWGITAACGKSCLLTYSTSRAELACALQISTCVCSLISPLPFLIGSFFSVVRNLFTFCLFGSFSWELSPATNKCSAR